MVALGVDGVGQHIRSIGLWQGKARRVIELSEMLLRDHGGVVPQDREALEALPGVGRKTANVVLNVMFGQSTMAVDTHVFRVANRTGMAMGETPREVEDGLVARIPKDMLRHAHHWLILHGRYVCIARRPECWRCVGREWCRFPEKVFGGAGGQERKVFFSVEKKQKTFECWRARCGNARAQLQKFFGSFFQKRTASFYAAVG